MKIENVEFIKGAVGPNDFPQDLPEIGVVGRSNVGKSTFLNFLFQRKKLVLTSKKPGKTREVNYFRVNQAFYMVDIPGFGYAKVSHADKKKIKQVLENYFQNSQKLIGVIYLLDLRHGVTSTDKNSLEWLDQFEVPIQFVTTKGDKLKKNQLSKGMQKIEQELELPVPPIMTSALKKVGREKVLSQIEILLESLN